MASRISSPIATRSPRSRRQIAEKGPKCRGGEWIPQFQFCELEAMALPNQRQKNDVARRVRLPGLIALLAVILCATAISPALAQAPTAAPSVAGANAQPTVTPAEAGQALDVLQDPSRRDALIQTLQTIARTSTPQPSSSLTPSVTPPLVSDGSTAETLLLASTEIEELSGQIARASAQLRNSRSLALPRQHRY